MKIRKLVLLSLLSVLFLITSESGISQTINISAEDAMQKIAGVYINLEHTGSAMKPQKLIITSDGRIEDWSFASQISPTWKGQYIVAASWQDSEGNLFCTVDVSYYEGNHVQELWKLSTSGNVLEMNYKKGIRGEYPARIDPTDYMTYYAVMYRE
jgi:hypothetical protein